MSLRRAPASLGMLSASQSYTQRRAHALGIDRAEGGARTGAPQRWRCSFSSGGKLVFGSRQVTIASLGPLDAASRDEVPAGVSQQRERAALGVAMHATQVADAHTAVPADVLRRYKETACPTSSASEQCQQSSLTEQHAWKLVAALFCPQLDDEPTRAVDGHATASSALGARDGGAVAAMRAEREREAMRAWLRDALWDGAALDCAAAEADGDLDGSGGPKVAQLRRLWALVSSLRSDEAVQQCLSGDGSRAYLGALLSQPAKSVREDLKAQLADWSNSSGNGKEIPLVPRTLARLFTLLSAGGVVEPPTEADADGASAGVLGEGQWMVRYARAIAGGGGLVQPPPIAGEIPPSDPLWHLLRLRAAEGAEGAEERSGSMRPLPTAADAGGQRSSWVRYGDYGFAWHLQRTVSPMLEMGFGSQPALHDAFAAQLESSGAFSLLVHAHACARDELALQRMLQRLPLPDGPNEAMMRLLDTAAAEGHALPAPLPPSSLEVLQSGADGGDEASALRLAAVVHSAAAARANYLRCFELSFAHRLTALRLGLAATEAMSCDTAGNQSMAEGDEAAAEATLAIVADVVRRSYDAARALLSERLEPLERMKSSSGREAGEARRRAQRRMLDDLRDKVMGVDSIVRAVGRGEAPLTDQRTEEEAEGKLTTSTLVRLAAVS